MTNPFSGFLVPQSQQIDFSPVVQLANSIGQLRQERRQNLEHDRQNEIQRGYLGLQQAQQARKFAQDDQAEVEGLLKEYQDSVSQGDPTSIGNAIQKLKRFGMDVSQSTPPANLRDFNGSGVKPSLAEPGGQESLQAKASGNPFNAMGALALKSGHVGEATMPGKSLGDTVILSDAVSALPGKMGQGKLENPRDGYQRVPGKMTSGVADYLEKNWNPQSGDLSQEDFENKLIADSEANPLPQDMERSSAGGTTPAMKRALGLADEVTDLVDPATEAEFQKWAKANGITDVNDPRAKYDYRGYFKETGGKPHARGDHFPDTYKQHGHPTFSVESKYSTGPTDGGTWDGDTYVGPSTDLGDVGSPEFQAAAAEESGQTAPKTVPGLQTDLLPSRLTISKGGKVLYSGAPSTGRWSKMVSGVFDAFKDNPDPAVQQAAQQAGELASKLVQVDGVSPKDAIEFAAKRFESELSRANLLRRSTISAEARKKGGWGKGGGNAGGFAVGAGAKADAALNDDLDKVRTMWVNSESYKKLSEQTNMLDQAEGGLMSPDGVSQNNALATLRRIQSGLTLNASEMADFEGAAGYLEKLKKKFERYLGTGQLPDEYKRQVAAAMQQMRSVAQRRMERGAQEAYNYWMKSRARAGDQDIIKEKGEALKQSLSPQSDSDPNSHLWE